MSNRTLVASLLALALGLMAAAVVWPLARAADSATAALSASPAAAATTACPPAASAAEMPVATSSPVARTVAVLGYDVGWLDDPKEAREVGEKLMILVSDRLGAADNLAVVERRNVDAVIKELSLNLSGLVDEQNRVRTGKLLGASFLLFGTGFKMDGDEVYLTTTVINSETGQKKGVIERFQKGTPTRELIMKVCDSLAQKLPRTIDELSPPTVARSSQEIIRARLGDQPAVWLIASDEAHQGPPLVDPAVQTELARLLTEARQQVRSLPQKAALSLVGGLQTLDQIAEGQGSRYCVQAQGVSQFGKCLSHDMVSCVARVEMKILDGQTGLVLAAGNMEGRATDLSEPLAAKQALKRATAQLFVQLVQQLPPPAAGK